jgi:hypothetical protein
MILPTTIIFENNFYKEYPSMCLMTVLIYLSIKIIKLKVKKKYISYKIIILFTFTLSLLCLLRETFHIFWGYIFLLLLGFLIKQNKKIIIAFLFFNILVLPFYLKNYFLYDRFGINLHFWRGINNSVEYIKTMKTENENAELKKIIFKNDKNFDDFFSKLSPFYYEAYDPDPSKFFKILNYKYKYNNSLLHSKTYFNEIFVKVDELKAEDLKKFIKFYPEIILLQVPNTLAKYFFKNSDTYYFARPNIDKIPKLIRLSSCLKITLSCIYETPFIKIEQKKILIPGSQNLYFINDYYEPTFKNQILYNLYHVNFILVIIYITLLFFFIKNLFNNNKLNLLINFWVLTFFQIFTILLITEKLEIPRHRFPFDYLSLLFLLYYVKNHYKFKKRKSTT